MDSSSYNISLRWWYRLPEYRL